MTVVLHIQPNGALGYGEGGPNINVRIVVTGVPHDLDQAVVRNQIERLVLMPVTSDRVHVVWSDIAGLKQWAIHWTDG
ncbi:hypothetical protein [Marinivivus vitaminiproducens]|uniref:hypothetical protein n=1 Tax=Marinivivus vitaminiproducens TaxID=3035935 RepID=UPI00279AF544|nr:hypothetical protein P4R82_24980 [Geminicoccaceae bacterium SCSIO 64248]